MTRRRTDAGRGAAAPERDWAGRLRLVSERELMAAGTDLLHLCGFRTYHTYDSRRSAAGFPDTVAVHPAPPRRTLFIEWKRTTGRLSLAQRDWLEDLERAGNTVVVVTPSTWPAFVRFVVPPEMLPEDSR